jgi:hypothetical protein
MHGFALIIYRKMFPVTGGFQSAWYSRRKDGVCNRSHYLSGFHLLTMLGMAWRCGYASSRQHKGASLLGLNTERGFSMLGGTQKLSRWGGVMRMCCQLNNWSHGLCQYVFLLVTAVSAFRFSVELYIGMVL